MLATKLKSPLALYRMVVKYVSAMHFRSLPMDPNDRKLRLQKIDGSFRETRISDRELNFDYIVLGAGSAGSIVASKLCLNFPLASVLLVERGPFIPNDFETVWDPTMWPMVANIPALEWGYRSTAQMHLNGRIIDQARAKGMGGCSIHNAMVYVRGGSLGFDRWVTHYGCIGWGFNDILPNFASVESIINVLIAEDLNIPGSFTAALVQACAANGIPFNPNYNINTDTVGISPFQYCQIPDGSDFRRETTFHSYIGEKAQLLPNLTILSECLVEKLCLNDANNTVLGIEINDQTSLGDHETIHISVNEEVILCGGSINNPQLLTISGIGRISQLLDHEIEPRVILEGVGINFQDDLYVPVGYETKQRTPAQPHGLMGAVIFDRLDMPSDDLRTNIESSMGSSDPSSFFLFPNIQLLQSRGEVNLCSKDPTSKPLINPNYLSVPNDIHICMEAFKKGREIGGNAALNDWLGDEINPVSTDMEIEEYVRQFADTTYHYSGTCKMGVDGLSVCDPQNLKVHTMQNLRIMDASIIPETVSGNTAAATMMIADKGSDFIINEKK